MIPVEVVQGHRQKGLKCSVMRKCGQATTEGFLCLLIRSHCPIGASQTKQRPFEILALES